MTARARSEAAFEAGRRPAYLGGLEGERTGVKPTHRPRDRGIVGIRLGTASSSPNYLAELRHDLANPLNHVVGYTELLVMGATERQVRELEAPLQALLRTAGDLRRHLEETLPLAKIRAQSVDLIAVRTGVTAGAQTLLEHVSALRPQVRGRWDEAEGDLEQIEVAARRLLDLAVSTAQA